MRGRSWSVATERGLLHLQAQRVLQRAEAAASCCSFPREEEDIQRAPKATRTECYKIREVLGIDFCVVATPYQRRAGRTAEDGNISVKVRGGFGEDKEDEFVPETRWVKLSELVANVEDEHLNALDEWAGAVQEAVRGARQRLSNDSPEVP